MRKPNVSIDLPAKPPRFQVGDHILVKIPSVVVSKDIWVARVESIENGIYTVQCLSSDLKFKTRIPHLFDKMLTIVNLKDLDKTIKAVRILYHENT
jgi:hypothetical protein